MIDRSYLVSTYRQRLELNIITYLSELRGISLEEAMDIYYRSELASQIALGLYGIDNLDYRYLTEDLIENELSN